MPPRSLTPHSKVWTLAWAPEIQTISVEADAPTREEFNITTGSDEVLPEVQRVSVSYDDVDEVQTITTSQVRCSFHSFLGFSRECVRSFDHRDWWPLYGCLRSHQSVSLSSYEGTAWHLIKRFLTSKTSSHSLLRSGTQSSPTIQMSSMITMHERGENLSDPFSWWNRTDTSVSLAICAFTIHPTGI